jgi:uncharacterized membrane protein
MAGPQEHMVAGPDAMIVGLFSAVILVMMVIMTVIVMVVIMVMTMRMPVTLQGMIVRHGQKSSALSA